MKTKAAAFILAATFLIARDCAASGYEFEGVGARQAARGGAAVADSDDWTAVYWNPGNIVRAARKSGLEFGSELFGGPAYLRDSNSMGTLKSLGVTFRKEKQTLYSVLGALGAVVPLGKRAALGLGFYAPILQGSKFQDTSPGGTHLDQEGCAGILVWNVSGSYALLENLSVGAGLDILYGRIHSVVTTRDLLVAGSRTKSEQNGSAWGTEGTFGVRYDPVEKLSLGVAYRTGSDIRLKGTTELVASGNPIITTHSSRFTTTLRHPPTMDTGLAFRPNKKWTLSFDVHWTFWDKFSDELRYDDPGSSLQNVAHSYRWRDTWKLRWGVRYFLTEKTELIGGYSRDRYAIDRNSIDLATALDVPMDRFSAAVAHRWGRRVESILGAVGGAGSRTADGVLYKLAGYQLMAETRLTFGGKP